MKNIHIVLFFSNTMSLHDWYVSGSFPRETALYKRLSSKGIKVSFVTYGNRQDLQYKKEIPEINICCNKWGLPRKYYIKLLPILHFKTFANCTLIKTNQMDGSIIAHKVSKLYKKPLIARCGYMWSYNMERKFGTDSDIYKNALDTEKIVFSEASSIVVTTKKMAEDLYERIPNVSSKVNVIPNYVDTNVFKKIMHLYKDIDVLFIGRLSEEKNLYSLLEAIRKSNLNITIIGDGELKEGLQKQFLDISNKITWLGRVPNDKLPEYINRAKVYILPSHYEGHPKTLLEAMACEAAVIGANSPGINNVIVHGENGFLCEKDPQSIKNALLALLADDELRAKLGHNAREYILNNMSLDKIIELELEVYQKCLK